MKNIWRNVVVFLAACLAILFINSLSLEAQSYQQEAPYDRP
jgi:hypothetical protein